jgi:N-acetylmuramoyl-L-alanine amidase
LRRPRLLVVATTLAALTAVGPVLQATVLAADPTVVVQPGDSLTAIARRTGVSVRRLVELNRLADPNRILAGQRLRVGSATAPSTISARLVHVVNRGSTVWHIAKRYGVTVSAIVAANNLVNPSRIFAGQRLVIPGGTAPRATGGGSARPSQPAASSTVHVVERGQHLSGIARRYGVSVTAIVSANGIANPSRIFAGQRLVIPGASGSAAAPAVRPSVPPSMASLMARRESVRRVVIHAADTYGVPRAFALAVAWQESGWQQGVVSHAGAVGVMQLMPATAVWVGEAMLGRPVRINDTRSNVHAGVRLLSHYLDRYDGNRDLVLAAYYQGQRAVDRHGIYPVSRPYIASIRHIERMLGG